MRHLVLVTALLSPGLAHAAPIQLPARDKQLHFAASAAISGAATVGLSSAIRDPTTAAAFGIGLGLSAGIAKELYDLTGRGTASGADLAWDVAGVAAGAALGWLVGQALFGRPALAVPF